MEAKRDLQLELASIVKSALRNTDEAGGIPPEPLTELVDLKNFISSLTSKMKRFTHESTLISAICNVVEAIFIHGLKESHYVRVAGNKKHPEPNFWPFVCKFSHGQVLSQIKRLSMIRTDIGRSRAWVRLALNEGVLEHYVVAFSRDRNTLRQFYHRYAFLRDDEQIDIIINYMKGLSRVPLKAATNSALLNFWTDTPLKLAGIITPAGNVRARGASTSLVQMDEIPEDDVCLGVSALEFDGIVDQAEDMSVASSSGTHEYPTAAGVFSDDDAASTVSHMSFMDNKLNDVLRQLQSEREVKSTGSESVASSSSYSAEDNGAQQQPQSQQVVVVSKQRATRRHKNKPKHKLHNNKHDRSSLAATDEESTEQQHAILTNGQNHTDTDGVESSGAVPLVLNGLILDETPSSVTLSKSCELHEHNEQAVDLSLDVRNELGTVDDTPVNAEQLPEQNESVTAASVTSDESSSTLVATIVPSLPAATTTVCERVQNEMPAAAASDNPFESNEDEQFDVDDERQQQSSAVAQQLESSTELLLSPADSHSPASCQSPAAAPAAHSYNSPGNSLRGCSGRLWSSSEPAPLNESTASSSGDLSGNTSGLEQSFSTVLRNALEQSGRIGMSSATADQDKQEHEFQAGSPRANAADVQPFADTMNEDTLEIAQAAHAQHNDDQFVVIEPDEVASALDDWQSANNSRMAQLACLPVERGLAAQAFTCPTCTRPLTPYTPYRVCAFDGQYYCEECHRNELVRIPAQLLHNWNLAPAKVSRASRAFLEHVADRPAVRVDQANPTIYEHAPQMEQTRALRERLSLVAMYLLTCKESVAEDLRKRLWPKEYLYEELHLYSINDLRDVTTGALQRHLDSLLAHAVAHVADCRLCAQKGFICELCAHPHIIFPFQTDTTYRNKREASWSHKQDVLQCTKCFSVYHSSCIRGRICPKCHRRELYEQQKATNEAGSSAAAASSRILDEPLGFG